MAEDLVQLQAEWDGLHRRVLAGEQLGREELLRAVELTRMLRETNTGPARKRRNAPKMKLSADALSSLLKGT